MTDDPRPVGGDRFTDSLRTLREFGRLLVIGFAAGDIPIVKVNRLLLTNVSVVGVGWGSYSLSKPGPVVPVERASEALVCLEQWAATGKVVLTT